MSRCVYDPASNSGHMLTKLTQGTLQYIGGELSHQGAVTVQTPTAVIGIRGGIGIISPTQVLNLKGYQSIQNSVSTTHTITNYMVNTPGWNMPIGPPFMIPPDVVLQNITILSSVNGQTGGGPVLKSLPTTGFACGTFLTPSCSWTPTNTGESDALQLLIQATKLATQPNPPPPPQIINTGALVRGP